MKRIALSIIALALMLGLSADRASGSGRVGSNCTCKGKKLYGRVQVVTAFPDIRVQVVEGFPDLNVKVVESFPDSCGEWELVRSFPDFTIRYVTSFPDLKIKMVTSFPGVK